MRRVLVAVDLDDHAHTAIRAARAYAPAAKLRIVHVARSDAGPSTQALERLEKLLREHAEGIQGAETEILEGPLGRAIVEEASSWRADTVVVAPRSTSRVARFLMGSISTEVLKHAGSDVLLARPPMSIRRILVCTDMHGPSERAAAVGADLAERIGAPSTLLFAADPALWGEDATAPWPPEAYELDADWLDRAQQEAIHEWLRKKLEEFNVRHMAGKATTALRKGMPKDVILRESAGHDLIVMATHGPSAYERAVIGSVAEHVAAHATASVLLVKR